MFALARLALATLVALPIQSALAYTPSVCAGAGSSPRQAGGLTPIDYCSCTAQGYNGRPKYVGPLDHAYELKHALNITSYRKEVNTNVAPCLSLVCMSAYPCP